MKTQIVYTSLLLLCIQGCQTMTTENVYTTTIMTMHPEDSVNSTDHSQDSETVQPPTTEPPLNCSDTNDWYKLEFSICFTRVYRICNLPLSQAQFNCVCKGDCVDTPKTERDCNDRSDWGKDGLIQCLHIINDCGLTMERAEYLCVCEDKCNKTKKELDQIHAYETAGKMRQQDTEHYIVKSVVYSIIFIVGLFGNIMVIVTVAKFMGKTTVTNIYICNLAVADLLVILICVPTKAVETVYMVWKLSEELCKVVVWLYFASFMWSSFTLMCMSLERYMVINHPMKAQMMSSKKRTIIIIAGIWILGFALSLPTFFVSKLHQNSQCRVAGTEFTKKRAIYIYIFVAIFFVPCVLMAFSYIRTSITLWKSVKKQQQMKQSSDGKEEKPSDTSGRIQVIRILIAVLVVFIICWAPYLSLQIYVTTTHYRTNTAVYIPLIEVGIWFNFLSLANSALNPILYGFLSRQFRMGFLRCLTCNMKGREPSRSYITTSGGVTSMTSRVTTATTAIPMKPTTSEPQQNGDVTNPAVNGGVN